MQGQGLINLSIISSSISPGSHAIKVGCRESPSKNVALISTVSQIQLLLYKVSARISFVVVSLATGENFLHN